MNDTPTTRGDAADAGSPGPAGQGACGSYDGAFFDDIRQLSRQSAERLVPLMIELLRPASVVDVGCGDGTWLKAFAEHGIDDYLGIDGDYVDRQRLAIDASRFRPHDLSQPFALDRRFDLAISLEVAEHLPPESADGFVESLTKLALTVAFSAAAPLQGGHHHLNEQWPDYWVERFARHGYGVADVLRRQVWGDEGVAWYYAQNLLLFVHEDVLAENDVLRRACEQCDPAMLAVIHPRLFTDRAEEAAWFKAAHERDEAVVADLRRRLAHYAANEHLDASTLLRMLPGRLWRALTGRSGGRGRTGSNPTTDAGGPHATTAE